MTLMETFHHYRHHKKPERKAPKVVEPKQSAITNIRVDWFKSSNKNHDFNQAIKIKKSCRFRPVCDVYDTFI